jgi:hypothetical protein
MMDKTARALTNLSSVDDQLSKRETLMAGLASALEERRTALREAIPGPFLAAYDALGRGRRPVIVAVRGAHCGGCYLRLPPQLDSAIRRRQSLCSCPHCGRLLYSSQRAGDSERTTESKLKPESRLAGNVRKSRQSGGNPGRLPAREEARAFKKREPRPNEAHREGSPRRASEHRGNPGSANSVPSKAKSVKR